MNSSKPAVRTIADICKKTGIRYAVFSPGSRSAPLVIAFSQISEIECLVIPDERSAGYFAMGLAQQTLSPVAVICTSGTAVLNLGPALCEAFYQHIPMLFLTADRPVGAAEKGENQAINQAFLFKEMTNASYDLDADVTGASDLATLAFKMETAICETNQNVPGPVHVNVRLSEPLYELNNQPLADYKLQVQQPLTNPVTNAVARNELSEHLAGTNRKLLVVGMKNPDKQFTGKLQLLAQREDIVVLTETTANLPALKGAISNYDACLDLMAEKDLAGFAPEMVITLGNQIISKKLRQVLKSNKPRYHWDISPYNEHRRFDIFDIETNRNPISELDALDCLLASVDSLSGYAAKWHTLQAKASMLTTGYSNQIAFSDFKAIDLLVKSFPENAHIQYGNSTPIRYSNFFAHKPTLKVNSNRGTSGIDGPVSTATGAAYATKQLTICVVGDVSFFYDSNALWNNYLCPDLRIVVINNSGGNIFRLLNGPTKVNDFEKFFETKHQLSAEYLAEMYEIPYYFCDHQERLEKILASFFHTHNGRPAILEIKTDGELSAAVYKGYFELLKNNK